LFVVESVGNKKINLSASFRWYILGNNIIFITNGFTDGITDGISVGNSVGNYLKTFFKKIHFIKL
jgi:hypothetical protein